MTWTYCSPIFRIVLIFCAIGLNLCPAAAGEVGEWRTYGSDNASTKYLPLDQINKDNVKELRIAWRWDSPDNAVVESNPDLWTMVNEATPLMIGGVHIHQHVAQSGCRHQGSHRRDNLGS